MMHHQSEASDQGKLVKAAEYSSYSISLRHHLIDYSSLTVAPSVAFLTQDG
jgi:hypothetical protein